MTERDVAAHIVEALSRAEDRGNLGTWSWQAGKDHMVWSAGLYRLMGMTPFADTPTIELCGKLVHPEDRPQSNNWIEMLASDWLDDRVFRIVRPNGQIRRVRSHGRAARGEDGRLLSINGISIDITDSAASAVREDPGLSHAQVRAARAYLGWTAQELADRAGVSFSTVRRVELPGPRAVRDENLDAIREAFARSGVRFVIHDDGMIGIAGR